MLYILSIKKFFNLWFTYEINQEPFFLHKGGRPGLVTVTITTESGFYLGKAFFTYEDPENETNQQVLCNKRKIEELSDIVQNLAKMLKQQGRYANVMTLLYQQSQFKPRELNSPT